MDLLKGYWQCEIAESDRHKTAFTWEGQTFQYTRLAFGLTSAGAIFSRCVSKALSAFHAKVMKIKKKSKNQDKKPETKSLAKKSSDRLEEYKKKCANEICEAFIKGNCKYGNRCFRIHPKQQNAHYSEVVEPEVEPEVKTEQSIQNLFH